MVAVPLFFRTECHGFFTNRTKAVTAEYVFSKESHFLISAYMSGLRFPVFLMHKCLTPFICNGMPTSIVVGAHQLIVTTLPHDSENIRPDGNIA